MDKRTYKWFSILYTNFVLFFFYIFASFEFFPIQVYRIIINLILFVRYNWAEDEAVKRAIIMRYLIKPRPCTPQARVVFYFTIQFRVRSSNHLLTSPVRLTYWRTQIPLFLRTSFGTDYYQLKTYINRERLSGVPKYVQRLSVEHFRRYRYSFWFVHINSSNFLFVYLPKLTVRNLDLDPKKSISIRKINVFVSRKIDRNLYNFGVNF